MKATSDSNFQSPNTNTNTNTPFSSHQSPRQTHQKPLRIADILHLQDDDDDDVFDEAEAAVVMDCSREGRRSLDCSSARRVVARWMSGLRRKRWMGEKVKREGKLNKNCSDRIAQTRCSINQLTSEDAVNSALDSSEPGRRANDATFNLGIGCCLLYLIVASRNELDKMMKMRMQMEMILQTSKEELQKIGSTSKLSEPNDFGYSTIDTLEGLENQPSTLSLTPSCVLPESSTITVCDQSLKCETPNEKECLDGMDQLEAELEAELERLQLHLDSEKYMRHPWQQQTQVCNEDSMSSKSPSTGFAEVIDHQDASTKVNHDVHPYELEIKLHELLESRQQEQIKELEDALECVKHKLHGKEEEVSWWKDAARLASQHATKSSRVSSQHGPKTYPSSR